MNNTTYKKALAEIDDILEYTDKDLILMIPDSFFIWIKKNKTPNYFTTINKEELIEEQNLLPETEAIISFLYRKYWSSEEEKRQFAEKDREEKREREQQKQQYTTDMNQILVERKQEKNKEYRKMELVIRKKGSNIFRKIINKIKQCFMNKER